MVEASRLRGAGSTSGSQRGPRQAEGKADMKTVSASACVARCRAPARHVLAHDGRRRRPRRNRDARPREQGDRPQGYDRAVVQGRSRCKDRVVLAAPAAAVDSDRAQRRSADSAAQAAPDRRSRTAIGDRDFRKVGSRSSWSKPDTWFSPRRIRERSATIRPWRAATACGTARATCRLLSTRS